eukprot:snap_masked-scaffold_7-processed-gene-3.21-mRNA-1 protein AED:0.21 eAED:0.21 QI:0/0/0/0.66/1/1/3/0/663
MLKDNRVKDQTYRKHENSQDHIKVFVRSRPVKGKQCCVNVHEKKKIVEIAKVGKLGRVLKSQQGKSASFKFDSVFSTISSQEQVFKQTTLPLMKPFLSGQSNITIFAYGATGSGKTHSMLGTDDSPGLIPQTLKHIFKKRKSQQEVFVSYMEIYNEQILDLLAQKSKRSLILCERENEVKILGLSEKNVKSYEEVMQWISLGSKKRKVAETNANRSSSRSHAIFKLKLGEKVALNLIDLAGSERAKRTGNQGSRLREGANINKSLLALANCINALAKESLTCDDNKKSASTDKIKWRDSKLTHILKPSLRGGSSSGTKNSVVMICCVNPALEVFNESLNSLRYANRAKQIKIKKTEILDTTNKVISPKTKKIKKMELEIDSLRKKVKEQIVKEEAKETFSALPSARKLLSSVQRMRRTVSRRFQRNRVKKEFDPVVLTPSSAIKHLKRVSLAYNVAEKRISFQDKISQVLDEVDCLDEPSKETLHSKLVEIVKSELLKTPEKKKLHVRKVSPTKPIPKSNLFKSFGPSNEFGTGTSFEDKLKQVEINSPVLKEEKYEDAFPLFSLKSLEEIKKQPYDNRFVDFELENEERSNRTLLENKNESFTPQSTKIKQEMYETPDTFKSFGTLSKNTLSSLKKLERGREKVKRAPAFVPSFQRNSPYHR